MLMQMLGSDVTLTTTVEPGCSVTADRSQLERVITNLAVNASDAMATGGRLVVSVSRQDDVVELAVSDSGSGMDAETLSHIFEPFFTTKDLGKGTGLGLATVYGIVTQAGGRVSVESEPGEGACFRVTLPFAKDGAVAVESEDVDELLAGTETILLAEDEETIRGLVTDVLTRRGYTVLAASTGVEALALLETHGEKVDLLFTDILMPGMTGTELYRAASARNPSLRVLFTSGYMNKPHEIFDEPGAAFIGKPFSVRALVAKLREVLDG
jgi:CheY-like chemotaxis protein